MENIGNQKVNSVLIQNLQNNKISVSVSVDSIVEPIAKSADEVRISTVEMQDYLEKKGYKLKACLKSAVVTNTNLATLLGEWLFELESPEKPIINEKLQPIVEDVPKTAEVVVTTLIKSELPGPKKKREQP